MTDNLQENSQKTESDHKKSGHDKSRHEILGAAALMSGLTMISRVLGYVRDALIAFVLGASHFADSFFVAFRVANFLRRLVGEGATAQSIVPVLTRAKLDDKKDMLSLVSLIFTFFAIALLVLTGLAMFFTPELVSLMAPGFEELSDKHDITVSITRLMFPYMFFIGLMAIAMGVLNTYKHFTMPALSPILLNISMISFAVYILVSGKTEVGALYSLAWAVLVGGLLQFLIQLKPLKDLGLLPRPSFKFNDDRLKEILILMGPAVMAVGVYQLNIFVTMRFASYLPEGSVSYLYYASRLIELPLGVFAVALAGAMLPNLSRSAGLNDTAALKSDFSVSLKMLCFVMVPSMVGLMALSYPIVEVLFQRGRFESTDTLMTTKVLLFYAIGIVPVALSRVYVSLFYALKDARTPLYGAILSFAANLLFCKLFYESMGVTGLAFAATLAALINYYFLFFSFKLRYGTFDYAVMKTFLKSAAVSLLMGALVYYGEVSIYSNLQSITAKVIFLISAVLVGLIIYVGGSSLMKIEEYKVIKNRFIPK